MPPRVLVTRPAREAAAWTEQLRAHGIPAFALPLIAVRACRDPASHAALAQAWEQLPRYRAVMFVSANAVRCFFASKGAPEHTPTALEAPFLRAWAPGPGTARALRAAGVAAAQIDGPAPDAVQFDSEALWQQVAPQVRPGDRILVVRGRAAGASAAPQALGQGRDWLARQIAAAGAQVDFVVAYERGAPRFTPTDLALARQAAHDGTLWLLSSSEAVACLREALPGQTWDQARALSTHPRIAEAAHAAGFGQVHACRPALEEVVASIESLA
ncbi:MAG: uroporphyrinogen-III synthase [Burkholderiaceae bacterium]|nr:uroporphyrinogen-III synthase [Burkholderiaceae bacterium]